MNPFTLRTVRALAGAGLSACLVAAVGLVSSSAAEPVTAPAHEQDPHAGLGQHWAQHLQNHLDRLAERLEIKASQEPAWQSFTAAFKASMGPQAMMAPHGGPAEEIDAATLARRHADRAAAHAQALARLADATAALEQGLSAQQRLVFNEVARHFAREHGGHGEMMAAGHGPDHCSMHGGPHGYGRGGDPDGDDEARGPHGHLAQGHGMPGDAESGDGEGRDGPAH